MSLTGGTDTKLLAMKLRLGGLAVIAMAALALSACGSADPSTDTTTTGGMQAYQDCLRKQGITLPSNQGQRPSGAPTARPSGQPTARPSGSAGARGGFGQQAPSGVDPAKWQAALEACASVRPTAGAGFPGGGGQNGGGLNAAYRNCLTEHGVTLGQGQQLNSADAKVAEALKACAALKPSSTPSN